MLVKNFYRMLAQHIFNQKASIIQDGIGSIADIKSLAYAYTPFFSGSSYGPVITQVPTVPSNGVFFSNNDNPTTFDRIAFDDDASLGFCYYNFTDGFSATVTSVERTVTDEKAEITVKYTITNESTVNFDIKCISVFCTPDSTAAHVCLIERTLLDTPVTIPVGGVGQVTYTICFTYPDA